MQSESIRYRRGRREFATIIPDAPAAARPEVEMLRLNPLERLPDADQTDAPLQTGICFAVAAICLAAGLVILVGVATSTTLWRLMQKTPASAGFLELFNYCLAALLLIFACLIGIRAGALFIRHNRFAAIRPGVDQRYDMYLVGVGYGLVLVATLNFVALAGFSKIGIISEVLSASFTTDAPVHPQAAFHRMLFLLLMPGFSILGALFFHANSLRAKKANQPEEKMHEVGSDASQAIAGAVLASQAAALQQGGAAPTGGDKVKTIAKKQEAEPMTDVTARATGLIETQNAQVSKVAVQVTPVEPFSAARFWGGLWFRVGEALLFTLVVFLFVAGSGQTKNGQSPSWSGPMILLGALLLGMFVKAGESLVAGLADKLFASARTLVGGK